MSNNKVGIFCAVCNKDITLTGATCCEKVEEDCIIQECIISFPQPINDTNTEIEVDNVFKER